MASMDLTVRLAAGLIKEFEGLRLKPYLCPAGLPTIGYGHLISRDPNVVSTVPPITLPQAEELLASDISKSLKGVVQLLGVAVPPEGLGALVSFVFNLGTGAFKRSTLRMVINRGEFGDVRAQLMRWNKVGVKVVPGLTRRRVAEAGLWDAGLRG